MVNIRHYAGAPTRRAPTSSSSPAPQPAPSIAPSSDSEGASKQPKVINPLLEHGSEPVEIVRSRILKEISWITLPVGTSMKGVELLPAWWNEIDRATRLLGNGNWMAADEVVFELSREVRTSGGTSWQRARIHFEFARACPDRAWRLHDAHLIVVLSALSGAPVPPIGDILALHNNLGVALFAGGKISDSESHFIDALNMASFLPEGNLPVTRAALCQNLASLYSATGFETRANDLRGLAHDQVKAA